jgi:hypothetical protein
MKDLIITNINLPKADSNGPLARVDLTFTAGGNGRGSAVLDEIGDASIYGAYYSVDASGMHYSAGKAYRLTEPLNVNTEGYLKLLADGYSHFSGKSDLLVNDSGLPVAINPSGVNKRWPQRRSTTTFLLSKDSQVQLAIVNGRIIKLADASLIDAFGGN